MSDNYLIGKDIGRLQAEVELLSRKRECRCGGGKHGQPQAAGACSPDDWRTVAMISEKSGEIKDVIEQALRQAGVAHADGSPLFLARITLTKDASVPKPDICGCCSDGSYSCCGQPGCDPCEPLPISFATPTSPSP